MAATLYSREILRLAASLVHNDHLDNPDATAEVRSPVCGSVMTVDLALDSEGLITAVALRANACALGQASAAIVRANAAGNSIKAISDMRTRLADALAGKSDMPTDWADMTAFAPACDVPARHAAILLPYDAILAAAGSLMEKTDV